MTREERKKLIKLLKEHVVAIKGLQFGDYSNAEFLCHRTQKFLLEHFPERKYEFSEVAKISFRSINKDATSLNMAWDKAYGCLLANTHSMLDELEISISGSGLTVKRSICAVSFLVIASIALWSFNIWLKWQWLAIHPKRIQTYLSVQVGIIFGFGLILSSSKKIKFIELAGLIISIISLIYSSL